MKKSLNVPKLNPLSGYCTLGVFEGIAKYQLGTANLKKLFSEHSFDYRRPASGLTLLEGNEFDGEFKRHWPKDYRLKFYDGMMHHYGIGIKQRCFSRLQDIFEYVSENIGQNRLIACDFNFGFMKKRKEYRKKFNQHTILIFGMDPVRSVLYARSQYVGDFEIEREDLIDAIRHHEQLYSGLFCFTIHGIHQINALTSENVGERIRNNLENLSSPDPDSGLNALSNLIGDIRRYFKENGPSTFQLPGIRVFGFERFSVHDWIQEALLDLKMDDAEMIQDVSAPFKELGNQWTLTTWMLDHGVDTGNPATCQRGLAMLEKNLELEMRAVQKWKYLSELL